MLPINPSRSAVSICMLSLATLLSGCAMQGNNVITPVPGTAISGTVHGGQQAISNAKVYLLAVNSTGYGGPGIPASSTNASLSLLTSSVPNGGSDTVGYYALTDASGGFSVAGDYSCTTGYSQTTGAPVTLTGDEQVYLYVLGGQPVFDNTSPNNSIGLLAALGPCNSPITKITLNEITTVGTAYAFAGFASDATHISSSGTSLAITGLNNAFNNLLNLVDITGGAATTTTAGGNGTTPTAAISTIANILAACVNSKGDGSSPCASIFPYMQASGSTGGLPTDTASAAINLAHNPYPTATGVATLYGAVPSLGAPFGGGLTTQPNDFTLSIAYSGGNLNSPQALAIDQLGNVWIANTGNSSLSEATSGGVFLQNGYTAPGMISPNSIAIDTAGTIWVGSSGGINRIFQAGFLVSTNYSLSPYGGNFISDLAVDAFGRIVFTSGAGWLGEIDGGGNLLAATNPSQIQTNPTSLAIDTSNNVWVGAAAGPMTQFKDFPGILYYQSTVPTINDVTSMAVNSASNVYSTSSINTDTVFEYLPLFSSASSFTPGTTSAPTSIAIDGASNLWVAAQGASLSGNSINEFSATGTNLSGTGFQGNGNFDAPFAVAIDGSGDVWAVNSGNNTLVELIGGATPVATPVAASLSLPYTQPASRP